MTAITRLQKTGYYLTQDDGSTYTDDFGHTWFTKTLARELAREMKIMYHDGDKTSIKTVVTGYRVDGLMA